jgi:hypothetical protein
MVLYLAFVALQMEVFIQCPESGSRRLSSLCHNLFFASVAGWRKFSAMENIFSTVSKQCKQKVSNNYQ